MATARSQLAKKRPPVSAAHRRRSSSEGGRPKKSDIHKGAAHWAEVLAERRRAADAPDKWMWHAAVWRFITEPTHQWLLELVSNLLGLGTDDFEYDYWGRPVGERII